MALPQQPLHLTHTAAQKLNGMLETAIAKVIDGFRQSTPVDSETPRAVAPIDQYDEGLVRAEVGMCLARTAAKLKAGEGAGPFEAKIRRLEDECERLRGLVLSPPFYDDPGDLGRCPAPSVRRLREELAGSYCHCCPDNRHVIVTAPDGRPVVVDPVAPSGPFGAPTLATGSGDSHIAMASTIE
jgi:hypothetical protein